MKKQLISIVVLFLSLHSFAQQIGNQGKKDRIIGDGVGRGTELYPYMLPGRKTIYNDIPQTKECKGIGRVVLDIVVDQKGNVLEAKIGRGTTTNALCLLEASKNAALNTKWNEDKNAVEKQNGKIVYNFKNE